MEHILIISLGGAGDTLMTTPMLRTLRTALPDARIDVLTMQGAVARDILKGNDCVSEIVHFNFLTEPKIDALKFCTQLRKRRYDASITVMPQNRIEYNAISGLIGARRRLGFRYSIRCGACPSLFLTDTIPEDTQAHLVDNNLALAAQLLGAPASNPAHQLELALTAEETHFAQSFLDRSDADGKRVIGIHPGSGTTKNLAMRRWAPEGWAALVRSLSAHGDIRIVMLGSPEEAALRQQIREASGVPDTVLLDAPQGTILQTAAIMARLSAFVCCDTLLTHIAAAVQIPTVVIMGPTPHRSVYPYGAPHRIVRTGIACSPCYGYSRHGIRCTHAEKLKCLKDITPDSVVAAIDQLLDTG